MASGAAEKAEGVLSTTARADASAAPDAADTSDAST
jgi:hypothetical protein